MKKIIAIISMSMLLFSNENKKEDTFEDTSPQKITLYDLEVIKKFDKFAYELAEEEMEERKLNIRMILNYIMKNKNYILDYNRIKVDGLFDTGRRTARGGGDNSAIVNTEDYNYWKVGVSATYNFYDEKVTKQIQNETMKYKSDVLKKIEKFSVEKEKIERLKKELKFERLKQLRDKAMQKTAQKYLDERLKTIENILKIQNDLSEKKVLASNYKLDLLILVKPEAIKGLEKMLNAN